MTALADSPTAQHGRGAYRGPGGAVPVRSRSPVRSLAADRSGTVRDQARTVRSWPLLLLAFPAAAEVWSGWVGIAQKTGFGLVSLLPGIWSSLHLDTTITLPIGVEAYAAYALRAWLAPSTGSAPGPAGSPSGPRSAPSCSAWPARSPTTCWSRPGESRAPWGITTVVSCLPVLVLAMGTALAHMLRGDAAAADSSDSRSAGPAEQAVPGLVRRGPARGPAGPGLRDQDHGPDQSPREDQRAR